jgi:hypothetical protein
VAGASVTNPTTVTARSTATDTRTYSQLPDRLLMGHHLLAFGGQPTPWISHRALAPYARASIGSREAQGPNGKGWSGVVEWANLSSSPPVLPSPPRSPSPNSLLAAGLQSAHEKPQKACPHGAAVRGQGSVFTPRVRECPQRNGDSVPAAYEDIHPRSLPGQVSGGGIRAEVRRVTREASGSTAVIDQVAPAA